MGFSLNPLHYIVEGAKDVASGAEYVAGGVVTGAKAVGSAGKFIGGYAVKIAKNKETWKIGVMAAGLYFGLPPNVTAAAFDKFVKTGKVPPGTDPRLAAYLEDSKPTNWPLIIGASAAGLVALVLLLRRRD
jgi:hypothetical protein